MTGQICRRPGPIPSKFAPELANRVAQVAEVTPISVETAPHSVDAGPLQVANVSRSGRFGEKVYQIRPRLARIGPKWAKLEVALANFGSTFASGIEQIADDTYRSWPDVVILWVGMWPVSDQYTADPGSAWSASGPNLGLVWRYCGASMGRVAMTWLRLAVFKWWWCS